MGASTVSDSGPNLGVRGVGFLLLLAGLFLIFTGYRIRKGTSRLPFTLAGAGAIALGAFLLGAGL